MHKLKVTIYSTFNFNIWAFNRFISFPPMLVHHLVECKINFLFFDQNHNEELLLSFAHQCFQFRRLHTRLVVENKPHNVTKKRKFQKWMWRNWFAVPHFVLMLSNFKWANQSRDWQKILNSWDSECQFVTSSVTANWLLDGVIGDLLMEITTNKGIQATK